MIGESYPKPAPAGKAVDSPLDSAIRSVRAAKFRVEDEAQAFGDWESRLDLAQLLGEAISDLLKLQTPPAEPQAGALHAACNCKGLLCDGITFDCSDCGKELPICRSTEGDSINLCDDCWTVAQERSAA